MRGLRENPDPHQQEESPGAVAAAPGPVARENGKRLAGPSLAPAKQANVRGPGRGQRSAPGLATCDRERSVPGSERVSVVRIYMTSERRYGP